MIDERRPTLAEYQELWLSAVMRRLPVRWTSDIGAFFGGIAGWWAIRREAPWVPRLHDTLRRLEHLEDPAERERRIIACTRRIGRVYAEFAVLQRIAHAGRIEIVGREHLENISRPAILASCHLGNWELVGHVLTLLPDPSSALYDPPENPIRHRLANRARQSWIPDYELIPASPRAVFALVRALSAGRNLLLYVDEERDGHVWAPGLGRALPDAGNRWLAARLAVRHHVDIVPLFVEQVDVARYRILIAPRLDPGHGDDAARTRTLADRLAGQLDRWIRPRLDQWYWLPWLDLDASLPDAPEQKRSPRKSSVDPPAETRGRQGST